MILSELKDLAVNAAINAGNFLNKNKLEDKEIYEEEGRDIKLIICLIKFFYLVKKVLENQH